MDSTSFCRFTQTELDLLDTNLHNELHISELKTKLDRAVRALRELQECRFQGGEESVKLGVRVVATAALVDMGYEE